MRRIRRRVGTCAALATVFCVLLFGGCYKKAEIKTEVTAVPVRTGAVEKRSVQLFAQFTARTDADPVNIVPRIRGYIEKINFFPGDIVAEGDVLYEIEQFDYKNDLEEAQAQLDMATAQTAKAKADYDRELELQTKGAGFTTQADLDRTKALWDEAKAKVVSAQAKVSEAEKELDRCTIRAPKRGKINRTQIEVGNLVDGTGANPPTLTTLMPMDPIYVYCEVTDSVFDRINNRILKKIKDAMGDKFNDSVPYDNDAIAKMARENKLEEAITFDMGLISDSKDGVPVYPYKGIINYNDNRVDRTTGTITIRGEIKNPNYLIYPGYICNVRVPGTELADAILIEEKAICYDLSDVYIWLVVDGKAEKRTITLGEQLDNTTRIVESGLVGGETYVLDGTQSLRDGIPVTEQAADSTEKPTEKPAEKPAEKWDEKAVEKSAQSAAPADESAETPQAAPETPSAPSPQSAAAEQPTQPSAPAQTAAPAETSTAAQTADSSVVPTAEPPVPAASLGEPVSDAPTK